MVRDRERERKFSVLGIQTSSHMHAEGQRSQQTKRQINNLISTSHTVQPKSSREYGDETKR